MAVRASLSVGDVLCALSREQAKQDDMTSAARQMWYSDAGWRNRSLLLAAFSACKGSNQWLGVRRACLVLGCVVPGLDGDSIRQFVLAMREKGAEGRSAEASFGKLRSRPSAAMWGGARAAVGEIAHGAAAFEDSPEAPSEAPVDTPKGIVVDHHLLFQLLLLAEKLLQLPRDETTDHRFEVGVGQAMACAAAFSAMDLTGGHSVSGAVDVSAMHALCFALGLEWSRETVARVWTALLGKGYAGAMRFDDFLDGLLNLGADQPDATLFAARVLGLVHRTGSQLAASRICRSADAYPALCSDEAAAKATVQALRLAFCACDVERAGAIDRRTIAIMTQQVNRITAAAAGALVKSTLCALPAISFDEWVSLLVKEGEDLEVLSQPETASSAWTAGIVGACFLAMDTDHSGAVAVDEFALLIEAVQTGSIGEGKTEAAEMFSLIKPNKDGDLNIGSMLEALSRKATKERFKAVLKMFTAKDGSPNLPDGLDGTGRGTESAALDPPVWASTHRWPNRATYQLEAANVLFAALAGGAEEISRPLAVMACTLAAVLDKPEVEVYMMSSKVGSELDKVKLARCLGLGDLDALISVDFGGDGALSIAALSNAFGEADKYGPSAKVRSGMLTLDKLAALAMTSDVDWDVPSVDALWAELSPEDSSTKGELSLAAFAESFIGDVEKGRLGNKFAIEVLAPIFAYPEPEPLAGVLGQGADALGAAASMALGAGAWAAKMSANAAKGVHGKTLGKMPLGPLGKLPKPGLGAVTKGMGAVASGAGAIGGGALDVVRGKTEECVDSQMSLTVAVNACSENGKCVVGLAQLVIECLIDKPASLVVREAIESMRVIPDFLKAEQLATWLDGVSMDKERTALGADWVCAVAGLFRTCAQGSLKGRVGLDEFRAAVYAGTSGAAPPALLQELFLGTNVATSFAELLEGVVHSKGKVADCWGMVAREMNTSEWHEGTGSAAQGSD